MKRYIRNSESENKTTVAASESSEVYYVSDVDSFDFSLFDPNADYKFPDFATYRKWVDRLDAEVDY